MRQRSFRSFAKINLGLEVVRKLPSGHHELKTIFATVSLHDIITISETRGTEITVTTDHKDLPGDETNLAHKAASAIRKLSGRKTGLKIHIRKRIAMGGGLGGGSSNAATVLRALDRIWGLGLGPEGLLETAKSLGADVPYFLVGGPALGLGRGDVIEPLDLRLSSPVLLIQGGGGVSTAAVFRQFGASTPRALRRSRIDTFLTAFSKGAAAERYLADLRNDLQPAAIATSPALARTARAVRRVGRDTGALQSAMSGSGSSFFLVLPDRTARQSASATLREQGLLPSACAFVSRRAFENRFEVSL